ncbi:MAG TPA: methylenetetrahydrofolate reductase [Dehalococcoidales bacterium]|nr:methylenetetrahydrofolate reductase [Dehalococcoidales bacterium]
MTFREKVESGKFVITCEIGPQKGTDVAEIETNADMLKQYVDAANVTDQQSSIMRLSGLAMASLLVKHGLEPIYQMTCRDRNRIALQSDLLGAWIWGVRNVLALTGDLPSLGDHPEAKPVFDLDSVTLLQVIRRLNEGFDMKGNELKGKTDYFPGAVVKVENNTEASLELQVAKAARKVAAGAKFIQTQAVYVPDHFAYFMKRIEKLHVPVLAGVIPLKNAGMAKYMNSSVAGVFVPDDIIQKLSAAPKEQREQTGIQLCADLIKQLKPMCQGVHIMAIGWEKKVPEIMALAGL